MRCIRRVGVLATAGILLTTAASGQAGAQTAASYTGSASGYALKLSVGDQGLTAGSSMAKASSDGTGSAEGAGGISPLATFGQVTATNPPGATNPEVCEAALPPAPLDTLISLGLGCGSATATGTGAESNASATGRIASLEADLSSVLSVLPTDAVVPGITGGLQTICTTLPTQLGPLAQVCNTVGATVGTALETITTSDLANGSVGPSASAVSVSGNSVTSESTAEAAVIRIAPTPVAGGTPLGEPLVTITVSRANARVVCDLSSGDATPSFDPAIVRVKLGGPLAALLPIPATTDPIPVIEIPDNPIIAPIVDPTIAYDSGELTVTPGATVVLFPGLPIETEIAVGSGTSTVNPDRSATASADGVKIHAARNLPAPLAGGLLLNLAHAEAAGACVAATAAVAPPATPLLEDRPRELPRTGGMPWLPAAGVAGLAVAVATRRALRSN